MAVSKRENKRQLIYYIYNNLKFIALVICDAYRKDDCHLENNIFQENKYLIKSRK